MALINVMASPYNAAGNGLADDTAACQNAITAADPGDTVVFPSGYVFSTSRPLVVEKDGVALTSDGGPGATNGGAGSGSGRFVAGRNTGANQITGTLMAGATIAPNDNWAQGNSPSPAVICVNGGSAARSRVTVERLNFYGARAGLLDCHGVSLFGRVGAAKVSNCGFYVFYGINSNGIFLEDNGTGTCPQGALVETCMLQFIGNDGVHGPFGDGTITRVHTQSVGGHGFWISNKGYVGGSGGNVRLTDCRGDLSAKDGFFIQIACGAYLGMVQLVNCSTQRNRENGFRISSAPRESVVTYLANCVAQGDGIAGGTDAAGYRISGPAGVSLVNSSCHVNRSDIASGAPNYGIVTTSDGVAPPNFVEVMGGLYNGATAWSKEIEAPLASSVQTFSYSGSQWSHDKMPTFRTEL
jgi:hypothetical protein